MKFFGYDISSFIPCEIPGCGLQGVDIHHIERRGMGGSKGGNDISNIMSVCREHHLQYGDKTEFKEWLKEVHLKFMQTK